MKKLNKIKVLRITEKQHETLAKMKFLKVDVGTFIRNAIEEKIIRDYKYLIPKEKNTSAANQIVNQIDKLWQQ